MLFLMGKRQHWKHLKLSLVLLVFWIIPDESFSQNWEAIDSLEVSYYISSYAIDQEGKIYLGSDIGDIYRYDKNWQEDKVFSGMNYSSVTTIEPWNRLKLFLFYKENQSVVFLDRFIATPVEFQLSELNVGFGSLATIGVDNSIWVLESNFNELRKYSNTELIFTTPLNRIDLGNASHIRAYQNLLILLDSKAGFYLFDQFGNKLSELSISGATYFHLDNKQVVSYDGKNVIVFDPFLRSKIQKFKGPEKRYVGVLKAEDYYYFFESQRVFKYQLK